MATWLTAWRNRDHREPAAPVMELLVVAGADAGNQFTIEGDEVLIGRGQLEAGVIRLEDKSISRRQAVIRRRGSEITIEHIESAANPTLVNGLPITRSRLAEGDRLAMGRVEIDVQARAGMNLRGLTEIMEDVARESTATGATQVADRPTAPIRLEETTAGPLPLEDPAGQKSLATEQTDVRPMDVHVGELTIIRGAEDVVDTRFPIFMGRTRIGRGDGLEVQIPELGVSRLHAEITIAGRSILLTQKSGTNSTLVNGFPILDQVALGDGDEIQLADRVVLGVRLSESMRPDPDGISSSGLSQRMEHKIDLDREIEEFNVMGSFLDVDVVSSRAMKGRDERAEHIIVSFDRFRHYVGGISEEWDGQVLNCNGDELMCFFESASNAVMAGSAILERLADFNRDLNLLGKDFRFRIGVHTGASLVDLSAGVAYSEVLDMAGHIQKMAEPNTLLLSQSTLDALPGRIPATAVAELTGGGGPLYRLDRFLRRSDLEQASPDSGTE